MGPHFVHKNGFTKDRTGTGWKTGKIYDFLFGFLTIDFFLALHAVANRS